MNPITAVNHDDHIDQPPGGQAATRGGDAVLVALQGLADALEKNAAEEGMLAARIREITRHRDGGGDWLTLLRNEESPGTVHLLSSVLARLSAASGSVRRSLVVALREEGATIPVIAQLFGVTHQRVSNLLRRSGD